MAKKTRKYKHKTHKGLKKRIRITAKGKIKHKREGTGHLMSHKSGKRVRKLRKRLTVHKRIAKKLERVLQMRLIGRD
jgi:large subunit ribosomal protein L35